MLNITINLVIGLIFFLLGLLVSRKTNLKISEIWHLQYLRKARVLFNKNELDEALNEYDKIKKNIEEEYWFKPIDYNNLLRINLKKRNVNDSIKYFSLLCDRGDNLIDYELKYEILIMCISNGYNTQAKEILLTGMSWDNARWLSLKAWIFSLNGDFEQAEREANKSINLATENDYSTYNKCANAFSKIGQNNVAHKLYKKCLLSEDHSTKMFAYINIGFICKEKQALEVSKKNLKNANRYEIIKHNYIKKGRDLLIEHNLWENEFEPVGVLDAIICETKDIEQNREFLHFSLKICPHSSLLYCRLAWSYYYDENYKMALEVAYKSLELNANEVESITVLTATLLKMNKYYKVIETIQNSWSLNINGDKGRFDMYIGEAYESIGNNSDAIKHYKIAIAKGFSHEHEYIHLYLKTIKLLTRLRKNDEAFSVCFEALAFFPHNKKLNNLLPKVTYTCGVTSPDLPPDFPG